MGTLVRRTTLIVQSIERSLAFWRDVLGLAVWYDDAIVLTGVGLAAGAAGDRTRLVIVKADDPQVGMIGLLEFTEPRLPPPGAARTGLGVGDIVIVLQGPDADGVYTRAAGAGCRIHAAPYRFEVRGADGRALCFTSLSLWDPDGYFIEYNEPRPAA
jgi:catechol 2,3-dioxygenase-like lactoylglutathione lyase family enzyme